MKNIVLIIATLTALMVAGCRKQDTPGVAEACRLEMALPPAQMAPGATKATENEIADVWIIQLKGADVVVAEYRTDFNIVGGSLFVDVLLKLGNDALYVVANTHNDALYTGVKTKTEVLAKQLPFAATQTASQLPMVGWMPNPDATKLNRLKLTYRVAKISVNVSTTSMTPGASFTPEIIKLCKVPQVLGIDSAASPSPAALAANFGADLQMSGSGAQSGVWYMAPNKRGKGTATSQMNKTALTAPTGQGAWCTYVEVYGQYKASVGAAAQPTYYRLWLGDNVVNNYDVRGGSFYQITMSILNVSAADARITVYDDRFDLTLAPSDGESDAETKWGKVIHPPAASDYVEINGLKWTKGNLIAVNGHECKVGAPADGGLYFQFGSLIGYKGGASGTGVGSNPNTGSGTQWWGGAGSYSWANDAMVWPAELVGTKTSWSNTTGGSINTLIDYYFNYSLVPWETVEKNIREFSFLPGTGTGTLGTGRYAALGVGDPCSYYLGDPWRLPTTVELASITGKTGSSWISWTTTGVTGRWATSAQTFGGVSGPGAWFGTGLNAGSGTPSPSANLFFPASGYRSNSNGSFYGVTTYGYYWGSSVYSATGGYNLNVHESDGVLPQNYYNRSYGFPVRCVASVL